MFKTLRDAFKIPDLRKKLIYTLLMFIAIRIGANIPIPGINPEYIKNIFENNSSGLLGMFDAFSGGAFANMTLFALGIVPYINASIIMNLLTIAIPTLEEMQKEGEEGRKKIAKITRYGTVVLAFIQAIAVSIGLGGSGLFYNYSFFSVVIAVTAMTAGTAFLMWVGEQITVKGIGNGISLIIFINIISRLPIGITSMYQLATGGNRLLSVIVLLLVYALMIMFVVLIQLGERRIAVQYAKQVQGRTVPGSQSTHIPLKVNMAGVIPVIFASSLLQFPETITSFLPGTPTGWWATALSWLRLNSITGAIIYFLFILFFAYFYTSITFNPIEVANNMKKNGGFVPGIRPGKPTVDYLASVLNKIVLVGALSLSLIALLPVILSAVFGINVTFGGTSLIIVVGVALETIKQIESQMVMRHYKGFLNA